ncbi:hypothetical protein AVEN_103337-1 [Araneus ventricosus]|uniref:Uncharacterized protein n=1 Tax=Araneus ventricosus TaxID=182803 RepID=A0A4Y2RHE1_ARAVE|nr:hypothetical protein AVEN_103337-1 [Araneus ventricosus]
MNFHLHRKGNKRLLLPSLIEQDLHRLKQIHSNHLEPIRHLQKSPLPQKQFKIPCDWERKLPASSSSSGQVTSFQDLQPRVQKKLKPLRLKTFTTELIYPKEETKKDFSIFLTSAKDNILRILIDYVE